MPGGFALRAAARLVEPEVPVVPVIALVGARLTVRASPKDVLVTRLRQLPRLLAQRPAVLSAPAIEEVERLARRPSTWH